MKRRFLFGWLVLVIFLAGCSAANSPKAAAEKFYKAIEKNDTKAMAEVATEETVQLIALFGTKMQEMIAEYGGIKTITETIDGDTAVVTATFENGEEESLDMVKVDGKWKVSISMNK